MSQQPIPIDRDLTEEQLAQIRLYAYGLYEKRGCQDGHDMEDWLEAKALWKQEQARTASLKPLVRSAGA